ncbi:MAG: DUF3501 family protein [Maricaulaceae bacterium]|jgi:hypothetical protein
MPRAEKAVTAADIVDLETFGKERAERRAAILPTKKLRRIEVGPHATFYFENFDTMLLQIQEMLYIEKGGEAQLADELSAYNPLIPQGSELVATVMFEIDDPVRRLSILRRLGGIEERMFIEVDGERIMGVPTDDVERTTEDGKTSSVHFVRFAFTDPQKSKMRDPGVQILAGMDHENYAHLAVLSPASRAELAKDFD